MKCVENDLSAQKRDAYMDHVDSYHLKYTLSFKCKVLFLVRGALKEVT